MAGSNFNPGRSVGRMSIRIVPDGSKFRGDLERMLERIEKTTQLKVKVIPDLDRTKFRAALQKQLNDMGPVSAKVALNESQIKEQMARVRQSMDRGLRKAAEVRVKVVGLDQLERDLSNVEFKLDERQAKRSAEKIKRSIDELVSWLPKDQLLRLQMTVRDPKQFEDEVRHLAAKAERERIDLAVAADTIGASAQLKWVSRDRIVNLFVRVSKSSATAALTSLAALSGTRLAWTWVDDLASSLKNLDKNLPRILGMTTGITSLTGVLFAATGGLVSFGSGLAQIAPAALVLPGLFLNAAGSISAMFVALKYSKEELAELGDGFNNLGAIIRTEFWDRARQPIVDMVNGLMPQLETSFRDLSAGIGGFTGALADAFGDELSDGRLESIFDNITEGWKILEQGAPAFAGAMVSLSNVAAKYTPRLASWFTKQANAFDIWLKATSEDGRLEGWIDNAIFNMNELWRATKNTYGVFEGLWTAAEGAGFNGMTGVADTLAKWNETVNSPRFQNALTDIFVGGRVAAEGFAGALTAIGDLIADNSKLFGDFIGTSGQFLGGFVEAAADALNNSPEFKIGLEGLTDGLMEGLEKIKPSLQPIADTFGNFLGLLGTLAETALPAATSILSALMPTLDALFAAIEPVIQPLADAAVGFVETLAPHLESFVNSVAPLISDLAGTAIELLEALGPVLSLVVDALGALADGIKDAGGIDNVLASTSGGLSSNVLKLALDEASPKIKWGDVDDTIAEIKTKFREGGVESAQKFIDGLDGVFPADYWRDVQDGIDNKELKFPEFKVDKDGALKEIDGWLQKFSGGKHGIKVDVAIEPGKKKLNDFFKVFENVPKPSLVKAGEDIVNSIMSGFDGANTGGASSFTNKLITGLKSGIPGVGEAFGGIAKGMQDALEAGLDPIRLGDNARRSVGALRDGAAAEAASVNETFGSIGSSIGAALAGVLDPASWMDKGKRAIGGIRDGANAESLSATESFTTIGTALGAAIDAVVNPTSFTDKGSRTMAGLRDGASAESPSTIGVFVGTAASIIASFPNPDGALSDIGRRTMAGLGVGASGSVGGVIGQFTGANSSITASFPDPDGKLRDVGRRTMQGLADGSWERVGNVVGAYASVAGSIAGQFSAGMLVGAGGAIMDGLASGIRGRSWVARSAAADAAASAVSAVQRQLGINSPSRVFRDDVGRWIPAGMAEGITQNAHLVQQALTKASDLTVDPSISGGDGATVGRVGASHTVNIINPVVRDLKADAREAQSMLEAVS